MASAAIHPEWPSEVMFPRPACEAHRTDFADILFVVFDSKTWLCWQRNLDLELNPLGWGYDTTLHVLCNATIGIIDEAIISHPPVETRSYDSQLALRQLEDWVSHVTGETGSGIFDFVHRQLSYRKSDR